MRLFICQLLGLILLLPQIIAVKITGVVVFPEDATSLEMIDTDIELVEVSSDPGKVPLKQSTHIDENGGFDFLDIPTGSFVLSVSSLVFNFQPFKTKIVVDENNQLKAYVLQPGLAFDKAVSEIPSSPIKFMSNPTSARRSFIKKRSTGILESGPVKTLIDNPLYLAGVVIAVGILIGPFLLEKFDPESGRIMAERRAEQKKLQQAGGAALQEKITQEEEPTQATEQKIETIPSPANTSSSTKNRKKKT